jgi:hypothetical protein
VNRKQTIERWEKIAQEMLVGRTIVKVDYLPDQSQSVLGWHRGCVCLQLDNGLFIFPARDDEGNGPGALFTSSDVQPVLPVI